MRYQLLYDAGNGYEALDLGDEAPAMNYQIANLNELKDRQAAYSQRIKLPKTANNMRILGFLDSLAVVADAAYTPGPCKLLCEGARISPVGAVLYVDGIDEYAGGFIDCQIVSMTVDLFTLLGDVDTEKMGDIVWENVWTSDRILSDNESPDGVRRWPAVFTEQGRSTTNPFPGTGQSTVNVYSLVPCYRFSTMIEQLLAIYGYRVESDLLDDPYMKSLYITASKITEDSHVDATYISKRAVVPYGDGTSSKIMGTVELNEVLQVEEMGGTTSVKHDGYPNMQFNQWGYYAPQPGDYKLQITIKNVGRQPLDNKRKVHLYAIVNRRQDYHENTSLPTQTILDEDFPNANQTVAPGKDYTIEVDVPELNTGSYIGWEIQQYGGGSASDLSDYTNIEVTAQVSLVHEDAAPGIGSTFDYARATGFKSYKEIVQAFIQLFCVLVEVVPDQTFAADGFIGTVRLYSMQELYRRRDAGQYVDWSRKLVLDNERSVGFKLANYAQRNVIQMTDNTDDGTHDAGSLTVANRTLTSEKTLFTIAAEAGRDIVDMTIVYLPGNPDPITERPLAVVPTLEPSFETDEDTGRKVGLTLNYKGCRAHLLRINEDEVFNIRINTFQPSYNNPYRKFPQSVTVPMQELIDRYYTPVKRLMANTRTINAYFNLSTLDIAQLDLFTPVWIEKYGCFFYISKINNFIAGQPTQVELVKMTSSTEQRKYYLTLNGRNQDFAITVPASGGTYRIAYKSNGGLLIGTSGAFGGEATVEAGVIKLVIDANSTDADKVGTVNVSVFQDRTVRRTITVTQEGLAVDPSKLTISLRTDGTDLYVATSRPLEQGEGVVVITRGSGRMAWNSDGPRIYHKSKRRWHIPSQNFTVEPSGKIRIPESPLTNYYRWRMKEMAGKTYIHIRKANRSRNFGYRVTGDMDKAVTFAVVVVSGKAEDRIEVSNRCYFESRAHVRGGVLTQEFAVTP